MRRLALRRSPEAEENHDEPVDLVDNQLELDSKLSDRQRASRDIVLRALIMLVVSAACLMFIGVFMVFSATAPTTIGAAASDPNTQLFSIAIRQALFSGVGFVAAVVLALISYRFIQKQAWPIMLLGMGLQFATLFIGSAVGGNRNWISLGSVSLQPSEFLKLAMIIWLAAMLARLSLAQIHTYKMLAAPAIGFGIATLLVVGGGDVGTGLVFVLIGAGMFWLSGMQARQLIVPAGIVLFGATILVVSRPSRLTRVWDFLVNFFTLPDTILPTQTEYAMFAFGTGGISGVGIGAGREKWRDLAEAHTDFIFAVVGEELGLLGVIVIIALFLVLGWSIITIGMNHPDRYAQLLCTGAALWLCGQAFANMWVVTGLLPVFGVPLPFVSMGGSSMMAVLLMVGAVVSCALGVPGVRDALRVRSNVALNAKSIVRR